LPPDRRAEVEGRLTERNLPFFAPQTDFDYTVHDVEIRGDRAVAVVRVEKENFRIEPRLYLVRNDASRWKIDRIENLEVDPRWLDLLDEFERREGEQLAEELAERLAGQPGVTVERAPLP
jgi:hypothetical protein